ncbi:MAG: hypothetical protein JOZ17_07800 [Acetobacteraceae bacterium]|nr:hypothetical protein [Acetobacteraceae bacterium]
MAHGRPRDLRKEQYWRYWIERWQQSDLGIRAFCERYQLPEPRFHVWRRQLRRRDAVAPAFVPVQVVSQPQPRAGSSLELLLADGRCLRIPPGFDPVTLRQLLAVLEEQPSC